MPTYQYRCARHHTFDETQLITDAPLTSCRVRDCAAPVHRVIQPVAVTFKGQGFYKTDNRQVASDGIGIS